MRETSSNDLWEKLHKHSNLRDKLDPEIRDSWNRCEGYDMSKDIMSPLQSLPTKLDVTLLDGFMLDIIKPLAGEMLKVLPKESAIILFGENGLILQIYGDDGSIEFYNSIGVRNGAIFSEESVGTSAAGLGERLRRAVQVLKHEHYCRFLSEYATTYAPIFNVNANQLVGGIGTITPVDQHNALTLGLVSIVARNISSRIGSARWTNVIAESLSEGIISLSNEGNIFFASKNSLRILKYSGTIKYSHPLSEIVDPAKPQNKHFWNIIRNNKAITDELVDIEVGKELIRVGVTATPYEAHDKTLRGKILILMPVERINRLTRKYSVNNASLTFEDIIGSSSKLSTAITKAKLSANTLSNILLLGESGTGKEVFAQAIHNESHRRNSPFVAVNCAALPRELIASELFGYEDGTFTGAKRGGKIGKFEFADQGTIFLDEIGEMPLDLQAILLRVIEEKAVVRLGGNKAIPVDVKIISATNRDIEKEVERNMFRRDLYYRLGVIKIVIPPLRERLEDIPALSRHFINSLCNRFKIPDKSLGCDVLDAFTHYLWPGNIRELQNILEAAVQWSEGTFINLNDIGSLFTPGMLTRPNINNSVPLSIDKDKQDEREMLLYYLIKYDYNKSKVAKELGITRKTLYKRLRDHGLIKEKEGV